MRLVVALSLFLLTACTPREQEFKPQITAPAISKQTLHASDGAELPLRKWMPKGKPRAIIIALHGFNDYSNAFEMPARYFQKRGIATYAYDQRGFGQSVEPGIWPTQQNLTRDVAAMVEAVQNLHPQVPVYLLGESMGGAVIISTLSEYKNLPVRGVILSAPAVWGDEAMSPIYHATLWLGAHTFPGKKVTGEGLKIQASDNIPMLRSLGRDPLVIKKTRIDAIYGLVELMGNAYETAGDVSTPALILYGAKDQVIPKAPVRHVAEEWHETAEFVYYDDGWHMLMRDVGRTRVHREIVSWIEKQNKQKQ